MTPQEGTADTSTSRAERAQTLLIMTLGISLPYGFHAIMNHEFHAASDYIIFIATIVVPLTIVILLERKKPHQKLIAQRQTHQR